MKRVFNFLITLSPKMCMLLVFKVNRLGILDNLHHAELPPHAAEDYIDEASFAHFADILSEALPESAEAPTGNASSAYKRRATGAEENWGYNRPALLQSFLAGIADRATYGGRVCDRCSPSRASRFQSASDRDGESRSPTAATGAQQALIHCTDCDRWLCPSCDDHTHARLPLHTRRIASVSGSAHFVTLPPTTRVELVVQPEAIDTLQHHRCTINNSLLFFKLVEVKRFLPFNRTCLLCQGTAWEAVEVSSKPNIAFITLRGRFDLYSCKFKCCNTSCATVISQLHPYLGVNIGYFPANPHSARTHVSVDVLNDYTHNLVSNSSYSFSAHCSEIRLKTQKRDPLCPLGKLSISPQLFHRCYREFSCMNDSLQMLCGRDSLRCPACFGDGTQCPKHIHIDGLMKLFFYLNRRLAEHAKPYHDGRLFVDAELSAVLRTVLTLISQSAPRDASDKQCGETTWVSAQPTTGTGAKKNDARADRGINLGVCPHNIMLTALSMPSNESFVPGRFGDSPVVWQL